MRRVLRQGNSWGMVELKNCRGGPMKRILTPLVLILLTGAAVRGSRNIAASTMPQVLPTYIALKTTGPPAHPVDGTVTLSLQSGAFVKIRAIDIDYDRTAAYKNIAVIRAETATTMVDKASGRKYVNLTFSRGFVATAWTDDVDYDVMRSGFSAFHPPNQSAEQSTESDRPSGQEDQTVTAKCAKEWPDDFVMRNYCAKTQREALTLLNARNMSGTNERVIRTKCAKDWPDDFQMRNYCEEQQLKAIRQP